MPETTLFSRIIAGEIPADIVYRDEQVTAFKDIHPKAEVHILVVPNRPIVSVAASTDDDEQLMGHLIVAARRIAEQLGVSAAGYRLVINVGRGGGQEVPHLHLHLLAGPSLRGVGFPRHG